VVAENDAVLDSFAPESPALQVAPCALKAFGGSTAVLG